MVAIPAVVGFNYFNRRIKWLISEATALKDLFIAYKD
jgi:biopolymer transport protein ExbB/TolQ